MKRLFDILFSGLLIIVLLPLGIVVSIWIMLDDFGSPFFVQQRVGLNGRNFGLLKFRSMYIDAPSVSTHLANNNYVTGFGRFLRISKLDETLQLFNVLKGDMSLVGPRPNLFMQIELIDERNKRLVYSCRPGITGLAQVNNVDMSNPRLLAEIDAKWLNEMSVKLYLQIMLLTMLGKGYGDRLLKS